MMNFIQNVSSYFSMPTFGKSQVEQSPESAKIQKVATSNMEKASTLNEASSCASKKRSISIQTTNTNLNKINKKKQIKPAGTICEDYFRTDPLQAYKDQFHSIRESFYNDIHNRKSLLELDKQLEYIQRELLKNKESNPKDVRMLANEAAKLTDEIYKKYNNPKLCNLSELYNNPEELKKYLIEKGTALDRRIRAGERVTISEDREVANMEVGALLHYLMTKTKDDPFINKKEDKITEFTEGTFLIHDPEHKIRSFLNSHQNAYDRVSSHYVGRSDTWHKGIDVCNNILPAYKRTIVYAGVKNSDEDVNKEYFYLKPENYGTDFWNNPIDFIYHGIEFIGAQANKILYPGCDDKSDMRKERVPDEVIRNFTKLLTWWDTYEHRFDLRQEYNNSKEVLSQVKKYGISYIERYLKYFKEEVENKKTGGSSIENAKKLIKKIRKYYKRAQNNHIRTGREVIAT